jgi:hypothetical protein
VSLRVLRRQNVVNAMTIQTNGCLQISELEDGFSVETLVIRCHRVRVHPISVHALLLLMAGTAEEGKLGARPAMTRTNGMRVTVGVTGHTGRMVPFLLIWMRVGRLAICVIFFWMALATGRLVLTHLIGVRKCIHRRVTVLALEILVRRSSKRLIMNGRKVLLFVGMATHAGRGVGGIDFIGSLGGVLGRRPLSSHCEASNNEYRNRGANIEGSTHA